MKSKDRYRNCSGRFVHIKSGENILLLMFFDASWMTFSPTVSPNWSGVFNRKMYFWHGVIQEFLVFALQRDFSFNRKPLFTYVEKKYCILQPPLKIIYCHVHKDAISLPNSHLQYTIMNCLIIPLTLLLLKFHNSIYFHISQVSQWKYALFGSKYLL